MTLEWTAHPAKRRPQDVMLAIAVVALTAWAVLVGLRSFWLSAVAVVMLLVAIAPFLVPTRYRLDDRGVAERRLFVTRARAWSELRRVDVGRGAALVSPYARPRWLDRYRGLVLYLDGADRDAVVRALRERISA
jgi:hypothetical protein